MQTFPAGLDSAPCGLAELLPPPPAAIDATVFQITAENAFLGRTVRAAVAEFKAALQRERGFAEAAEIMNSRFAPAPDEVFFIIGAGPAAPLGYAVGTVYPSLDRFTAGVSPTGQPNSFRSFCDPDGHALAPARLLAHPEFCGSGSVCHLEYIQALRPGHGHGTRLLDGIKASGLGLIIAEADNPDAERFFTANRFVHTGFFRSSCPMLWVPSVAMPVLAWRAGAPER